MNICHVNFADVKGGAARAAYRIHRGLLHAGQSSAMYVLNQSSRDSEVQQFRAPMDWSSRIRRLSHRWLIDKALTPYLTTRPSGFETFNQDRAPFGASMMQQLPACDIINLHWVAGFIDYVSFLSSLPPKRPLVWTLHDMNAFTGGCHYSGGCTRYQSECGACPQLGSHTQRDLAYQVWQRKMKAFANLQKAQLHIVTPSRWLAQEARASSLFRTLPITVIPHGLDTEIYTPRDRWASRHVLDLPQDARVVLMVAFSIENRRKGFSLLADALAKLSMHNKLILLTIGEGNVSLPEHLPVRCVGTVTDDRLLSTAYSAADLFVIPSLEEAFGLTGIEAMACGTPIVGFNVGGIPDIVRPGITGQLVPVGNVKDLAQAITELLNNDKKRAVLAENCRRVAQEEYNLSLQVYKYKQLYESMIDKS